MDQVESAIERLAYEFQDKPNIVALLTVLATPYADLETAAQQVSAIPSVDNAFGEQLDVLGAIVGEARQGNDDTTYRLHSKGRIWGNRSSGTPEDLYRAFSQLVAGANFVVSEEPPAAFVLHINGVAVSDALAEYLLKFLRDVKPAGVRGILHWLSAAPGSSFCFAGGPGLGFDGGLWSNAE